MQKSIYEVGVNEKQLANIGRQMMDFSEYYPSLKGMNDDGLRELNNLSHVGNMLTKVGNAFGPRLKDFTQEDLDLIARFVKKELDTQKV